MAMPAPGEVIAFALTVDEPKGPTELPVIWTVSVGEIINGQGTRRIQVRFPSNGLTSIIATVEVSGLPAGCARTAAETIIWCLAPQAVKTGVLYSFERVRLEEKLREFTEELRDNPNNQGYLIIDHKKTAARNEIVRKEKFIADILAHKLNGFDRSRITIVRGDQGSGISEFWRVPPGASNPTCEECEYFKLKAHSTP